MTDWGWPRDVDDAVDNHSLKVQDGQHLVIHRRVDEPPASRGCCCVEAEDTEDLLEGKPAKVSRLFGGLILYYNFFCSMLGCNLLKFTTTKI